MTTEELAAIKARAEAVDWANRYTITVAPAHPGNLEQLRYSARDIPLLIADVEYLSGALAQAGDVVGTIAESGGEERHELQLRIAELALEGGKLRKEIRRISEIGERDTADYVTLKKERDALRETNSKLNRRCQSAESAARETVEAIAKKGPSFGRALAAWAAGDWKQKYEAACLIVDDCRSLLAEHPKDSDRALIIMARARLATFDKGEKP